MQKIDYKIWSSYVIYSQIELNFPRDNLQSLKTEVFF